MGEISHNKNEVLSDDYSGLKACILSRSKDTFIIVDAVRIKSKFVEGLTPTPSVRSLVDFSSSRSENSDPRFHGQLAKANRSTKPTTSRTKSNSFSELYTDYRSTIY